MDNYCKYVLFVTIGPKKDQSKEKQEDVVKEKEAGPSQETG